MHSLPIVPGWVVLWLQTCDSPYRAVGITLRDRWTLSLAWSW